MSVSGVATSSTIQAKQHSSSIAGNFDSFLRLLTTQLANQDPLSPMDSNQFTEQLVQFASVEQAVNSNSKLERLVELLDGANLSNGASYLGREIVADGRTMELGRDGSTSFTMTTAEKPALTIVRVTNAEGHEIATLEPTPKLGEQTVIWDGRKSDGFRAPNGTYRVEVEAYDASGAPLDVSTGIAGTVHAVETDGEGLHVYVGDRRIALEDIEAVRLPAATPTDEGASS